MTTTVPALEFPDPFGPTADPDRYVPRAASERALEQLVQAVRSERHSVLLEGVPGIGKTLLLRLLARRLEPEPRVLHLPYAALPATALCAWALKLLDAPPSRDPVGAMAVQARRTRGLVLLIDDAETMAESELGELAGAAEHSGGMLRLVLAADERAASRLAAVLIGPERVLLLEPMSAQETASYVAAHLEAAELPVFAEAAMERIHASGAGIPAQVNAAASRALRVMHLAPPPEWAPEPEPEVSAEPPAEVSRGWWLAALTIAAGLLVGGVSGHWLAQRLVAFP